MNSEKADNSLNLSLDISAEGRSKSSELETGYIPSERTWELIIKYDGDISFIENYGGSIVYLSGGYAIITVPQSYINELEKSPQIIYIEKPRRLFFNVTNARRASCISDVQINDNTTGQMGLFGEGVLCAVIDSGIDYAHNVFRNQDGSTRILTLWDQNVEGNPPQGYQIGSIYTYEDINKALNAGSTAQMYEIVPSRDLSGHGTHVAGIMAGNFATNKNNNIGVATRSKLIVVKLGRSSGDFPQTSELMQAINFVINEAVRLKQPLSINLSYGNTYGSHDGTSLLETFINSILQQWKVCMSVGTGNEGNEGGHTGGILGNITQTIQFAVGDYQQSFSIQLWKEYQDVFDIVIRGIKGQEVRISAIPGSNQYIIDNNKILVYYGEPSPISPFQEIYIEIIPDNSFVTKGIWELDLIPQTIISGRFDLWLPSSQVLSYETGFLRPTPDTTMTIPSTALNVITVGAYDSSNMSYADFSGRGYTRLINIIKPEIVAPGVNISSSEPGGGFGIRSGTSMATPFVAGG